MSKSLKFLSVAILVIAIGGSYFFPQIKQGVLGAVSTLDGVDNPFVSINGVKTFNYGASLTATSSYVCSFQNPYNATTSIVSVGAESTANGIAVANNLYVSTSTTAFGTSTPALVDSFAMGTGQWTLELQKNSATSTQSASNPNGTQANLLPGRNQAGASNYILGPTEWVTFKIATTTGGTFSTYNVGKCSGVLKRP